MASITFAFAMQRNDSETKKHRRLRAQGSLPSMSSVISGKLCKA